MSPKWLKIATKLITVTDKIKKFYNCSALSVDPKPTVCIQLNTTDP